MINKIVYHQKYKHKHETTNHKIKKIFQFVIIINTNLWNEEKQTDSWKSKEAASRTNG